jgi:uncharacterized protein (DUF302 family)
MYTEGAGGPPANRDPAGARADVVTKRSPWSVPDTVARLSAVIAARGLEIYAVVDHAGKARDAGLALRDTRLVIFGSPAALTPLIEAAPLAALDLPVRIAVWEEGHRTLISYPAPEALIRRHGFAGDLAAALSGVHALVDAVIER